MVFRPLLIQMFLLVLTTTLLKLGANRKHPVDAFCAVLHL